MTKALTVPLVLALTSCASGIAGHPKAIDCDVDSGPSGTHVALPIDKSSRQLITVGTHTVEITYEVKLDFTARLDMKVMNALGEVVIGPGRTVVDSAIHGQGDVIVDGADFGEDDFRMISVFA